VARLRSASARVGARRRPDQGGLDTCFSRARFTLHQSFRATDVGCRVAPGEGGRVVIVGRGWACASAPILGSAGRGDGEAGGKVSNRFHGCVFFGVVIEAGRVQFSTAMLQTAGPRCGEKLGLQGGARELTRSFAGWRANIDGRAN